MQVRNFMQFITPIIQIVKGHCFNFIVHLFFPGIGCQSVMSIEIFGRVRMNREALTKSLLV